MKVMNKLKLGVRGVKDVLSREALKQILGGNGGSSTLPQCNCTSKDDCTTTDPKKPQNCMNHCDLYNGYAGHCSWDGTSGS